MTFDAGTWWLAVLLLGFVTAGLVYLLKRSLFGRIDKLDESMKEISENSVKKSDYGEIMECMTLEDNGDIKRSDKYSIYLAAVEPSLRDTAKEVMAMEAELPPEDRELKEPLDIVNMFDLSEITQISTAIMELSGAMNGKVTVVEDLKK